MRLFKNLIKLFILIIIILSVLSLLGFVGYNFVVKIIKYYSAISEALTTTGIILFVAWIICKLLHVSFLDDFLGWFIMSKKDIEMLRKDGYYVITGPDLRYGYKEPFSHKLIQFIVDVIIFCGIGMLLYYGTGGLL